MGFFKNIFGRRVDRATQATNDAVNRANASNRQLHKTLRERKAATGMSLKERRNTKNNTADPIFMKKIKSTDFTKWR